MIQLLHHCVEHDITTFDTADFHGGNYANRTFGTALGESGLSRDEIQLLSKCNFTQDAKQLKKTVDDLLLELRTDYLDLLLIAAENPSEEEVRALTRLHSQGKILEIGSLHPPLSPLLDQGIHMVAKQIAAPLEKMAENDLNAEQILAEKISILVWWDSVKELPQTNLSTLEELQGKYHLEIDQLLLAWLLEHPAHLHPILSTQQKTEIDKLTAVKEVTLDAFDWQKINLILS